MKWLISLLTASTGILHLLIGLDVALGFGSMNWMLVLNGAGYLVLLFLYLTSSGSRHNTIRWILLAYTLITLIGYFVINWSTAFDNTPGLVIKAIELLLVILLFLDRGREPVVTTAPATATRMGSTPVDLGTRTATTVTTTAANVAGGVGAAATAAAVTAAAMEDKAAEQIDATGDRMAGGAAAAYDTVDESVEDVGYAAGDAWDATTDRVGDAAGATADVADDAWDTTTDMAASAGDAVGDAWDATTDRVGDAVDATADVADDAWDTTTDMAASAGDAVGDAWDATTDRVGDAVDATADVASDAWDATTDMAADAGDAVGGAVDATADMAGDAWDATTDRVGDAVDATGAALAGAGAAVGAAASDTVDAATAEPTAEELRAELEDYLRSFGPGSEFRKEIEYIEGIGTAFGAKLRGAGVNTVLDLMVNGATRRGRKQLSDHSGIDVRQILTWVNHIDLYRIKGVAEEYADLLEQSGVDTVVELAQRNPSNLFKRMNEINQQKQLVRRTPHQSEVQSWVEQAKNLKRLIHY